MFMAAESCDRGAVAARGLVVSPDLRRRSYAWTLCDEISVRFACLVRAVVADERKGRTDNTILFVGAVAVVTPAHVLLDFVVVGRSRAGYRFEGFLPVRKGQVLENFAFGGAYKVPHPLVGRISATLAAQSGPPPFSGLGATSHLLTPRRFASLLRWPLAPADTRTRWTNLQS